MLDNKKSIYIILAIAIVLGVVWYAFNLSRLTFFGGLSEISGGTTNAEDLAQKKLSEERESYTRMGGSVVEVRKNSIVMKGTVLVSDLNKRIADRTVEFFIVPGTVFRKTVITMPEDTSSVTPATLEKGIGSISDFAPGMFIKLIQGSDDLSLVDKTTTKIIEYDVITKFK